MFYTNIVSQVLLSLGEEFQYGMSRIELSESSHQAKSNQKFLVTPQKTRL